MGDVVEVMVQDENGNFPIGNVYRVIEKNGTFSYNILVLKDDFDMEGYQINNVMESKIKLVEDDVLFI